MNNSSPDDVAMSASDRLHYNAVDRLFSLARHNRLKEVPSCMEEYGFDVDVENQHGNTLLCVASQNGLKRMAKVSLRLGANIDHQNGMGNTPLHFCCAYGFAELAAYLISKGANPMVRNENGVLCTEGLGKDALRLVNQAITEAQDAGLLDDTVPQHTEQQPVVEQEQVVEQVEEVEEEPFYQHYEQEEAVEQVVEQARVVAPIPQEKEDVFGVASWSESGGSAAAAAAAAATAAAAAAAAATQRRKVSTVSSSASSDGRWRPLPKAPRPRPLPKQPRPLPSGVKGISKKVAPITKPIPVPKRTTSLMLPKKKKKSNDTVGSTNSSTTLPKLVKAAPVILLEQQHVKIKPLPVVTPRTRYGYSSVLQAVHANDISAVRGLTGQTSEQDIAASLHACGLSGSNEMLEILYPHSTQRSLDRAMIAATARSNHNVVQYMLSQKSGSGEKTGEKTGESVSQSGIDRALVRAAAVIGRDGTNSVGGGE